MEHELDHYDGRQLLVRLGELFNAGGAYQNKELHFVFVCGGKLDPATGSMRSAFLSWVGPQFPSLIPIRAEAAFQKTQLLNPAEFPNLGRFETLIAGVADCVVIFPESEGSYAELGLFSNIPDIRKKTLVVNLIKYQASNSFLQLGPIDEINVKSRFRPALHVDPNAPPIDFAPIRTILVERLKYRERRKRLAPLKYAQLDLQQKLIASHELIRLFGKISLDALFECFRAVFGDVKQYEIRKLVSLLLGMETIEYLDEMLGPRHHDKSYVEFDKGADPAEFSAKATLVLAKHDNLMSS
jgi:hypothetical protein